MKTVATPTNETPSNGVGRSNACIGGQHNQCRSNCSCNCHRRA